MKMKLGTDDVRQLWEDVSRMIRRWRRLAFSAARTPTVLRNLRRTRTVRMVDGLGLREIGENVEWVEDGGGFSTNSTHMTAAHYSLELRGESSTILHRTDYYLKKEVKKG